MPFNAVMPKFAAGKLHSGSKSGPPVKNRKQAVAIMLSEKQKAAGGKTEYASSQSKNQTKSKSKAGGKMKPSGFASIGPNVRASMNG